MGRAGTTLNRLRVIKPRLCYTPNSGPGAPVLSFVPSDDRPARSK